MLVDGCDAEQLPHLHPRPLGQSLQASERQVALAPLHPAHVGPMHAQHVGEGLLAEPSGLSIRPQVSSDGSL